MSLASNFEFGSAAIAEMQPLTGSVPTAQIAIHAKRPSLKKPTVDSRRSSTNGVTFSHEIMKTERLGSFTIPEDAEVSTFNTTHSRLSNYDKHSPIVKNMKRVARIPTEAKLKTITHKVKRPAVDIEFHDLVYTAKTATGK